MGLDKYTDYVIQILGYTIADGVYSEPLIVRTAEDGMLQLFHGLPLKSMHGLPHFFF